MSEDEIVRMSPQRHTDARAYAHTLLCMCRPRLASNKLKTWFIIVSNWEGWTSHLTALTTRCVYVQINLDVCVWNAWQKETLLLRRNKTTKSRISRSLKFSPICLTFCKKYMGRVDVYDFDDHNADSSNKVISSLLSVQERWLKIGSWCFRQHE